MIEAEISVGRLDLDRYQVGDSIRWLGDGVAGGPLRNKSDDYDVEGYTECPTCEKDFWLDVTVRSNQITDVVASDRDGYK